MMSHLTHQTDRGRVRRQRDDAGGGRRSLQVQGPSQGAPLEAGGGRRGAGGRRGDTAHWTRQGDTEGPHHKIQVFCL